MAFDYSGARAAGYTDEEIQSYLNSKKSSDVQKPFNENILTKGADFFLGGISNLSKAITGSRMMGATSKATGNLNEQLNIRIKSLQEQATREPDPIKKQQLLSEAQQSMKEMGQATGEMGEFSGQVQKEIGYKPGMSNTEYALRGGAAVGADVAQWILPQAKVFKTAAGAGKLAQGAAKVGNVLAQGATTGTLSSIQDIDKQNFNDMATSAITGAVTQGVMAGVGGLAKKTFNALTKSVPTSVLQKALRIKDRDVMKKALDEGIEGNYDEIIKVSSKVEKEASDKLSKLSRRELKVGEVLGKTPQEQADSLKILLDYMDDFDYDSKVKEEYMGIIEKTIDSGKISWQEANRLKTLAAGNIYKKSGDVVNTRKAEALERVANRIRGVIRQDKVTAELLDTQQAAIVSKLGAEIAKSGSFKTATPNILELSALLTIPYGYSAPAAAYFISKGLQNPKLASASLRINEKLNKMAGNQAAKGVKEFFRRSTVKAVSQEMTE